MIKSIELCKQVDDEYIDQLHDSSISRTFLSNLLRRVATRVSPSIAPARLNN